MIDMGFGGGNYSTAKTNKKYNLSPYTRINIDVMSTSSVSPFTGVIIGYTQSDTDPMNDNNITGNDKSLTSQVRTTVYQDITNFNAEAYIVIGAIRAYVYRVWLS